eukprot:4964909-Lingulodinium_polyedra.AAC.1
MHGCVVAFAQASGEDTLASSKVQFIGYVSRKQKHVCRASFAVELFVAVDIADMLMMLNGVVYELQHG